MDILTLIKAKEKDQKAINSLDALEIKKIFKENTSLLKKFIEENGWPSEEVYGPEVSSAAWLIAQHSDLDPMFQLQCLSLIIANYNVNDKELMQDMAFLLDRVLVNMNEKQIFGTQLNGKWVIPEIIDSKYLDFLRKKFGLEPIGEYIKRVRSWAERKED